MCGLLGFETLLSSKPEETMINKAKLAFAFICAALILFGIVYNMVALPFSSPTFDLISWIAIVIAALILLALEKAK